MRKNLFLLGILGSVLLGNSLSAQNLRTDSTHKKQVVQQIKSFKILEHTKNKMRVEVLSPKPEFEIVTSNGKDYLKFKKIEGLKQELGTPEIPQISYTLNIPTENLSVRVLSKETESIQLEKKIKPVFQDIPNYGVEIDATREAEIRKIEEQNSKQSYSFGKTYPSQLAEVLPSGSFRGNELVALKISPYIYTPSQNVLAYHSKMILEITFAENPNSQKSVVNRNPSLSELEVLSKTVENFQEARAANFSGGKKAKNTNSLFETKNFDTSEKKAKVVVDEDGIYRVTRLDLERVNNLSLINFDPRYLKVFNGEEEIPIYFKGEDDGEFGDEDYFEFWGERRIKTYFDKVNSPDMYQDPYLPENYYYLSWEKDKLGLRLVDENVAPIIVDDPRIGDDVYSSDYFDEKIHYEDDRIFSRLGYINHNTVLGASQRDHWFWREARAFSTEVIEIDLPGLHGDGSASAKFTMALHGRTNTPHHVTVSINNQQAFNTTWSGQSLQMLYPNPNGTNDIPQSLLNQGVNNVTFQMDGSTSAGENDVILVNWIDAEYKREFIANNDQIIFRKPVDDLFGIPFEFGVWEFNVKGFESNNIIAYKKGISRLNGAVIGTFKDPETKEESFRFRMQDRILSNEVEYILLSESQIKTPKRIELNTASNLKVINEQVDYIIISHPDFLGSKLNEFADFHDNTSNLNTKIVDVMDIYDEFGFGHRSPEAIKSFLTYAYENWPSPAPSYVLFVGDTSWNGRLPEDGGGNFIPSIMLHTLSWGLSISDFWYGLLDNDFTPELYVGRFPVNDRFQLEAIVNKTIEHGTNPSYDESFNNCLMISGGASLFSDQTNVLVRDHLPQDFNIKRLNTSLNTSNNSAQNPESLLNDRKLLNNIEKDVSVGGTSELVEFFDEGLSIINFMGHGGGAIWADGGLFRLNDVDRTTNQGKYPFVTSMTCFAGAFDEPQRLSLSEKMLIVEDKGAIGILASSGLGWTWNDYFIVQEIWSPLLEENRTIGESVWLAKQRYLKKFSNNPKNPSPQEFSMVAQYNLLGDPAARLYVSQENFNSLEVSNLSVTYGDSITISGEAPFEIENLKIAIANSYGRDIAEWTFSQNSNQFSEKIAIPNQGPITTSSFDPGTNSTVYSLKLEDDLLNTKTGYIKIYADNDNPNNLRAANQFEHFTIEGPNFISAEISPQTPIEQDSIFFNVFLEDNGKEIQEVTCVGHYTQRGVFNPSNLDDKFDLQMIQDSTNPKKYSTTSPWVVPSSLRGGFTIIYFFRVTTSDGTTYDSQIFKFLLEDKLDFVASNEDFWLDGEDFVTYNYRVTNNSATEQTNVPIELSFAKSNDTTAITFSHLIPQVPADSFFVFSQELDFASNYDFDATNYLVNLKLNSNNSLIEKNYSNNETNVSFVLDHFNVLPSVGTTLNNSTHSEISVDEQVFVNVNAGVLSQANVLKVQSVEMPNNATQEKFVPFTFEPNSYPSNYEDAKSSDSFWAYKIDFSKIENDLPNGIEVKFKLDQNLKDSAPSTATSQIAYFDSQNQRWKTIISELDGEFIKVTIEREGIYALFSNDDQRVPAVEVNASGSEISDGNFVPASSKISLIMQDESGVDIETIFVILNGDTLNTNELLLPDSTTNANVISIPLNVELNTIVQNYLLEYSVYDYAGNLSTQQVTFKTVGNETLKVYGNFPNPFGDAAAITTGQIYDVSLSNRGTIFAFEITNIDNAVPWEIKIDIFSVAGRKVKRMFMKSAGGDANEFSPEFQLSLSPNNRKEIYWDGTDDKGRELANGIYFYVISVKGQSVIAENINEKFKGKLAKFKREEQ